MTLKLAKVLLEACKTQRKNVLGLDFRAKYIDAAMATLEPFQGELTFLSSIVATQGTRDLEELQEYVNSYNIGGIIVGDPCVMDYHDSEPMLDGKTRSFISKFEQHAGLNQINYAYQNNFLSEEMAKQIKKEFDIEDEETLSTGAVTALCTLSPCLFENYKVVFGDTDGVIVRGSRIYFDENKTC